MKKIIILTLIILFAAVGLVNASSPVSLFPGETDNINRNPAMLSSTDYSFALQFDPAYIGAYNNAWTANQVFDNINAYIDDSKKREILDSVSSNGFAVGAEFNSTLNFGRNNWGLRTGVKSYGYASLDKEVLEFILDGMTSEGDPSVNISLQNTEAKASVILDTGYAKAINYEGISDKLDDRLADWEDFHFGFGMHYLTGLANADSSLTGNANLDFTDSTTIEAGGRFQADYTSIADDGVGHGLALDLGFWGSPNPNWELGVAINNIGFMRWPSATRMTLEDDIFIKLERENSFQDGFKLVDKNGDEISDLDTLTELDDVEEERIGSYTNRTPISVQADAVYKLHPKVDLAGSLGFHEAPTNNFSVALASRFNYPNFMYLTVGMNYDTFRRNVSVPLNISFKTSRFELINLYVSDLRMIPAAGKGMTVGLSTGFRF